MLLLVLLVAGGLYVAYQHFVGPGPSRANITVVIPRGSHLGSIGDRLEQAGVVENGQLFAIGTRLLGNGRPLLAGFLTSSGAANFGWTGYAPLPEASRSPGVGGDLWIMALVLTGLSGVLTAVNIITTVTSTKTAPLWSRASRIMGDDSMLGLTLGR